MINLGMATAAEAGAIKSDMPFPECGAMSQGYIGYHLQNSIANELAARGIRKTVGTLVTQVLVDEKESIATVLVCGAEFLREKPEVAKALVQAHEELNEWIRLHPDEAQLIVVRELEELTHSRIDPALIAEAWKSIVIKDRISIPKLRQFVQDAHQAGFMKEVPDIGGLVVPEAAEEQLTMAKEAGGR